MDKPVLSSFKEAPATKCGWTAFILSIISLLSGPILGISAAVFVPFIADNFSDKVGQIFGFSLMIIMFVVLITTFVCSIRAFVKKDRSWAVIVALTFSSLSVAFWILMILGEFLVEGQ